VTTFSGFKIHEDRPIREGSVAKGLNRQCGVLK